MKLYIVQNISGGQVLLKSPFVQLPVKIARGSEHMFESEQQYMLFAKNVGQMEAAGYIKLKTMSEKKSIAVGSYVAPKQDEKVEETVEASDNGNKEKIEAFKTEIKALQDEYKSCEDEARQSEIKERISEIKKEVKKLK